MNHRSSYATPQANLEYPEPGVRVWRYMGTQDWRVEAYGSAQEDWRVLTISHGIAAYELLFPTRDAAIEAGRALRVQLALEQMP